MVIGSRGPIRWASRPARGDRNTITTVTGSRELPAATGENPIARWSTHRQQEERAGQRRVDDEGHRVRSAELARTEQRERHHRPRRARLVHDERDEQQDDLPTSEPTVAAGQCRCGPSVSA